ncbi:CLUMA_CG000688, isoform A [Clunio marinus]|uniref:CLUMA_CG000688, isoform A n=1 Tax=Clunio marinus TaxID=568069 RepID=A0A1J1HK73_9DIPT|nr:CLUMA_CG000688, isoform A [Clunio marinus]
MKVIRWLILLLVVLIIAGVVTALIWLFTNEREQHIYEFSKDFKFGAASASYQIEGGWNADGKTPNIWDTLVHTRPELIKDQSNADVGADSYHFYKEDVKALKNAGLEVYRFSISWARIVNETNVINQAGIDYYNNLIDELIKEDIEPLVTMYHWDLPQYIEDLGGFQDPILVEHFKFYANVLFKSFGDRVKRWITFNEPWIFCIDGYSSATKPPLIESPGFGEYLCGHHMLQAHAAAYKLYNDDYREQQTGEIGICLFSNFFYPDSGVSPEVAEKTQQFQLGWFTHPIFSSEGNYPKIMIDEIKDKTVDQPLSRLPIMDDEMKNSLIGAADFLALNYYTSRLVAPMTEVHGERSWQSDVGVDFIIDEKWEKAKSWWLYNVPQGLHDLLKWIKAEYNNPTVLITENGYSDDGQLDDDDRINYIKAHLAAIHRAIHQDRCKVVAYTVWSIIDNFEWMEGFTEKFGIHAVNLTSPNKERIAKKSVSFFKDLTDQRQMIF